MRVIFFLPELSPLIVEMTVAALRRASCAAARSEAARAERIRPAHAARRGGGQHCPLSCGGGRRLGLLLGQRRQRRRRRAPLERRRAAEPAWAPRWPGDPSVALDGVGEAVGLLGARGRPLPRRAAQRALTQREATPASAAARYARQARERLVRAVRLDRLVRAVRGARVRGAGQPARGAAHRPPLLRHEHQLRHAHRRGRTAAHAR